MELKRHAKHPLEQMWSFLLGGRGGCARRVAALAVATDVALSSAERPRPDRQRRRRWPEAVLKLDEMQSCPIEAVCAGEPA